MVSVQRAGAESNRRSGGANRAGGRIRVMEPNPNQAPRAKKKV
jgi:hypothetical protein